MDKIIPQKYFKKTPETFSDESLIINVDKREFYYNVVLDSIDEVVAALKFYSTGSKELATINAMDKGLDGGLVYSFLGGGHGSGLNDGFMKGLINEVVTGLKTNGRYSESFHYTFNNFDHTSVGVYEVRNKYVLKPISIDSDKLIAKAFNKPLALGSASALFKLSVVDDWWYNFNIIDFFDDLPLNKDDYNDYFKHFFCEGNSGYNKIKFGFDDIDFELSLWLKSNGMVVPDGGEWPGDKYAQLRDKHFVGPAWKRQRYDEMNKSPEVENPFIELSVSLYDKKFKHDLAVTQEEMDAVINARDYILSLVNY